MNDVGEEFQFEAVYNTVKHLPKYAIDPSSLSASVKTALGLDLVEDDAKDGRLVIEAPRPKIGKKKAKDMKFKDEQLAKKVKSGVNEEQHEIAALHRLAAAQERKNYLVARSQVMSFFANQPDGPGKPKFNQMMEQTMLAMLEDLDGASAVV